jgi:hypothetical protein
MGATWARHDMCESLFCKLTGGSAVIEAGIKVFEDIDWDRQRAVATGQGITGILA